MSYSRNNQLTLKQKFMSVATLVAVALPLSLALGYLNDMGQQKSAEGVRDRLTEDQMEMIEYAVENDQCGMLHSRHANLCWRVERGDISLNP